MSGLIEFVPFNLGIETKERGNMRIVFIKALLYAVPFLVAIYPMIWTHGKILDLEVYVMQTVEEKYNDGEHIRFLTAEVQRSRDNYKAFKNERSFFRAIFWFIDPKVAFYEGMIEEKESALTAAIKLAQAVDIPFGIRFVTALINFLGAVVVAYIWFVFFKFYAYLVFRIAPSCGLQLSYSLNTNSSQGAA